MGKNTRCLSAGQIVPDVRRYSIFVKLDAFDLFLLKNVLRGSQEISGASQLPLKNWNIQKILKNHEKSSKISNI